MDLYPYNVPTYRLCTFDLGSKIGHTICTIDKLTSAVSDYRSGNLQLATPEELIEQKAAGGDRCFDIRIPRLLERVRSLSPDAVVFEDVVFATSTFQAQLWASLRTVLWIYKAEREAAGRPVNLIAVNVQSVKTFMEVTREIAKELGTKEAVLAALRARRPDLVPHTEEISFDEIDAACMHYLAHETILGHTEILHQAERARRERVEQVAKRKERKAQKRQRVRDQLAADAAKIKQKAIDAHNRVLDKALALAQQKVPGLLVATSLKIVREETEKAIIIAFPTEKFSKKEIKTILNMAIPQVRKPKQQFLPMAV